MPSVIDGLDKAEFPSAVLALRLRHARRVAGLTLLQLGQKAQCSESLISKIENGNATPSLASLHRLAVALNTNIAALTAPLTPPPGPVMRSGERPIVKGAISLERITLPADNGLLQANVHIIAPGVTTDGMIEHAGEEVGYVLEGMVELSLGDQTYRLSAGDSFNFSSDLPHGYRNPGDVVAKVLWVNTPATY
ncbi:XRE family transcriptional regulator [Paraburkholderia fungorum]|uniref:XRE family transcriptional regulator n=1 Tax=Paraburkholderia fungorum TaxID=134537 RepID=A0AAP5V143_9BURK|nr:MULTISPECIES: XRE family transcriptional regulator [Paraburkholderia]MDR8399452.1 XRE family transcriptional regulator [Paraburkholderia sp. USG1]MDT8843567.1 XRE family transcriptional regulator [Paraburkholderia fungorum]